jgi:hypothetical protein
MHDRAERSQPLVVGKRVFEKGIRPRIEVGYRSIRDFGCCRHELAPCGLMVNLGTVGAGPLEADGTFEHVGGRAQISGRASEDGDTPLQHDHAAGKIQHHVDVLLDQDATNAGLLDKTHDRRHQLLAHAGGEAFERLVEQQRAGLAHQARPTASICCSPPGKLRASVAAALTNSQWIHCRAHVMHDHENRRAEQRARKSAGAS